MNKISFEQYFEGRVKIDKICDFLIEDIEANDKQAFFDKWNRFQERFPQIETLNISKVWHSLIFKEKTDWFDSLPFNKTCGALEFAARKYYSDSTIKNKQVLDLCFNNMVKISKSSIFKSLENVKKHIVMSFYEEDIDVCKKHLQVILELDDLYRNLQPQNPDKFLTFMIIAQGKEIQVYHRDKLLTESVFFNNVTTKLIERLISFDSIGANKLNNKKPSASLNDIYDFFKKYYMYNKLDTLFKKYPEKEKEKVKKLKI